MLSTEYQKILHRTRPVSGRHPMAVEKRAKQFAPFAALKGFEDEIHEQEIRYEEKRILPEEKLEELDRTFHMLKEGMEVEVEFYLQSPVKPGRGQYYTVSGEIEGVSGSSIWVQGQEISCGSITEIRSGPFHDLAGM